MHKFFKYLLLIIFLCLAAEFSSRLVSLYMGYGFFSDNKRFISPFFTGTDIPSPIINDSNGIFVGNHKVSYDKEEDEIRIIFIGGSTTKNHSNPEKLIFSKELNNILDEYFHNFKVTCLNAGVDGFSSAHSLVNLSLRLIEFNPDIVVIHHNVNDRTASYYGHTIMPDYANKYLSDHFLDYKHRSGFNGFLLKYFKSARILFWGSKSIKSLLQKNSYNYKGVQNKEFGSRIFQRNLQSIIAICKQFNIIPILLTQPHRKLQNSEEHKRFNKLIVKTGERENVYVFKMAEIISENIDNFIDDYHYSASGILHISEILAPYLAQIIENDILEVFE